MALGIKIFVLDALLILNQIMRFENAITHKGNPLRKTIIYLFTRIDKKTYLTRSLSKVRSDPCFNQQISAALQIIAVNSN